MAEKKKYADAATYEAKLARVMERLGITDYHYDWSRFESFITFTYKGSHYRFSHGVTNAKEHGIDLRYGSDAFAQLVLSLEDLARMVERGIYDLGTWVAGMKYLPEATIDPCFTALGFASMPSSPEEVKQQYHRLAKVLHPDSGGSEEAFRALVDNYEKCLSALDTNL